MPVSLSNNVVQVSNTQVKKQPETKSETKSSIGTGAKVAIGTGLAALTAIGIYVVRKGIIKNERDRIVDSLIQELLQDCKY